MLGVYFAGIIVVSGSFNGTLKLPRETCKWTRNIRILKGMRLAGVYVPYTAFQCVRTCKTTYVSQDKSLP